MVKLHSKDTNKTRSWNDPNGLGWQLWRRVHATGLSSVGIQRDIGRMHTNTLVARASLMADIHRRWDINQDRAASGYSLSFPLVIARFPPFYPGAQSQDLSSLSRPMGRPTAVAAPVPVSGLSRLSKTTERSETLTAGHAIQRAPAIHTGFVRHEPNRPRGHQRPEGPDGFKGYDGHEDPDRTLADQTSGPAMSLQRSKPAAEANATENDTGKPIKAPRSGAAKEVNLQRSAQSLLSRSVPTPAAAEATSKKNIPATKPLVSINQYGRRIGPSTSNQNTPSSQSLISRGNQSYEVQLFPGHPGSNLFSNAIRRQHTLFPRSKGKSTLRPSAAAGETGAVVSRSKAGVASQLPQFGPVALYSGASKTPLHRKITDRLGRVRGGDEPMPVILRSPAIGTASTSTALRRQRHLGHPLLLHSLKPAGQEDVLSSSSPQSPYPVIATQAAHFSNTPISKSISSGPLTGTALNVVAATDRWTIRSGTSSRRLQGHRDPIEFFSHQSHLQASPLTGSRALVAGKKVLPTSPLLYSIPAASMRKATRSAKESLSRVAGGRNAAPAALTMPGMVTTSPGRGKAQIVRQSDRIETASPGDDLLARVISRAPAINTTLTNGPFGRQAQHRESGRNHAAYDTEAVTSRSGVPQIIESIAADRSTLYRQPYNPAETHLQSNKHADTGTEGGAGEPRWAPGKTSLSQLHEGRVTHFQPYTLQPMGATGAFLAARGPASLLRMAAETPYGAMRLPMPASNIVLRHVAGHTKNLKNEFPLSSSKNSGSALFAVGRTGAAVPETNGDTSSRHLNFSVDPLNTSFSRFGSGHNLLRRLAGRPMVMRTVAYREASHAAGTDRRPDKSGDWRTALLRQAVYPESRLRLAAGKDTRSGGPATPEIGIPIGAWSVIPQLARSIPLKWLTRCSEASSTPMMGKTFHERTALLRQAVYPGSILRLAAGKDIRSGGSATAEIATPIGAWPVIPQLSRSLPLNLPTGRNEASLTPMMGKTSHELPLFYKSAADTRGGTSSNQQAHRSVVSPPLVQLPGRNMTPVPSVFESQRVRETPAASETETAAAGARMDTDELVEKIWQKIMRKLTIEQERRGCTPWV